MPDAVEATRLEKLSPEPPFEQTLYPVTAEYPLSGVVDSPVQDMLMIVGSAPFVKDVMLGARGDP